MGKFLGILVTPDDVQNEGLDPVFEKIMGTGAQAITFGPWISHPVDKGEGYRLPDLHLDGHNRLLDRPLFGEVEVYLESSLSYKPSPALYSSGSYQPPSYSPHLDLDFEIPDKMIERAHELGLGVHLELAPLLLPGLQPKDRPLTVCGEAPLPILNASKSCVNNENARKFAMALIEDTVNHYPNIDGLILDWTEFDSYFLQDQFSCFCNSCRLKAQEQNLDWDKVQEDIRKSWNWLHELTPDLLYRCLDMVDDHGFSLEFLFQIPGWERFLIFKQNSVHDFIEQIRKRLDQIGFPDLPLTIRGWIPPFNFSSGLNYHDISQICSVVAPKIFTFDHTAIPRWWAQTLLDWNPELPEELVLDLLVKYLNLPDRIPSRRLSNYCMPRPEKSHNIIDESYLERINSIVRQVSGQALTYPYLHAYRNESQWEDILRILLESEAEGIWVQMYGYLSDRKFEILSQVWQQ